MLRLKVLLELGLGVELGHGMGGVDTGWDGVETTVGMEDTCRRAATTPHSQRDGVNAGRSEQQQSKIP